MKTKTYFITAFLLLVLFTLLLGYITNTMFIYILSLYGAITISKWIMQVVFSIKNNKKDSYNNHSFRYNPTISIIVAVYNEPYISLYNCIKSIINQKYDNKIEIFLIDDGSKDLEISKKVREKFKNVILIQYPLNEGKRCAQKIGMDSARGEIIVTVDSDTILNKDAISNIVKHFNDTNIGAVTGDVRVLNSNKNWLTKLLKVRYWFAFNQERAAQSLFGCVMCCSGVISAYRNSIINKIKEKYVKQKFLGHECHFGDDRHLTNLVLNLGHKVYYCNKAIAYTIVPENLKQWLKQQLRWNKSFYREIFWNISSIPKQHSYMAIELFLNTVLPMFLLVNIGIMFYRGVTVSFYYFLIYVLIMVILATIKSLVAYVQTKDINFFNFTIYTFLHIFLLLPVRILAILTLPANGWGTR